ncbi:hypothetical protein V6B08_19765 [Ferrovibrio sp. MS7]|jgi:hypothetical protein|uniref:hypothetical protein n=1 Tax=Ferrovibrio TaxID=1231242 RepID=UPI001B78215A|nr:hypothetical protein [Ferrovibrio sp.]
MKLSQLQRAALVGILVLGGLGATGVIGMKVVAAVQAEDTLPLAPASRNECINEGLRKVQGGFSRQTAYDIEVRCEQLIQSHEGRKAALK